MDVMEPSSVTLEEAVARMIDLDYLPETVSLLGAAEYLESLAQREYDVALENGEDAATISKLEKEISDWRDMYSRAEHLLESLEASIINKDQHLQLVNSGTVRKRLSTQSVYKWALEKHGIKIPEWNKYRISPRIADGKIAQGKFEGDVLLGAISCLIDELLSQHWLGWKGDVQSHRSDKAIMYFKGDAPNVSRICSAIADRISEDDTPLGIERTIRKHVKLGIDVLTNPNHKEGLSFSSKEMPASYKTLLGLFILINDIKRKDSETTFQEKANSAVALFNNSSKQQLVFQRFVKELSVPKRMETRDFIDCLFAAWKEATTELKVRVDRATRHLSG